MATGNYVTGGPKAALGNSAGASEREDLANYTSLITRDDPPFVSSIGKNKADAIKEKDPEDNGQPWPKN